VIPAASYGAWGSLATWLPSGALGEAMRAVLDDAALPGVPLLVLLAWGAAGTVLTTRTFRWE
jgi:ABC-2 type transport system permease protein